MDEPRVTFTQRQGWFKRVELALHEDDLFVRCRVGRNEYHRRVPLEHINPLPFERTVRRRGYLQASVFAFLLSSVSLAAMPYLHLWDPYVYWTPLVSCWIGLAFACAYLLKLRDFVGLFDDQGGVVLVLDYRRPSPRDVQAFMSQLIAAARVRYERMVEQNSPPPGAFRTACEIEKSHTLLQAGVLDPDAFETRKRALLRAFLVGAVKPEPGDDEPLAEISQRQGLFNRCTFRLFSDRLERMKIGPFERSRSFANLSVLPENPDKRTLPRFFVALAWAILLSIVAVALTDRILAPVPAGAGLVDRVAAPLIVAGIVALLPFAIVWWLRRRPVNVLLYRRSVLAFFEAGGMTPNWWIREGLPSKSAVDSFLKALTRVHRDFQENRLPATELYARFQGLYDREILTEEELLDIHARLAKTPRSRPVGTGWGITPSRN